MVFVDRHDVVEFGNGPIGAEETAFMEVNGVLCSQALENRELSVGLKNDGLAWVKFLKRHRPWVI